MKAEQRSTGQVVLRIVLGLALLAPAGLCCLVGLVIPSLYTVVTSLQDVGLRTLQNAPFVGLANYTRLFGDKLFTDALGFTLLLLLVRVVVVMSFPLLPLGLAVNEFGRWVRIPVRLLFTVPLALFAPVAAAIAWGLAIRPNGLIGQRWLSDPNAAKWAFLVVDNLLVFALAGGLALVFYLAALRGSGTKPPSWRRVLVLLFAGWLVGILATVALTLPTFTLSYVLTAGGPMNTTTTLGFFLYRQAFQFANLGTGAALATLILIVEAILGLAAGLIVVLTGLRLEMVPWGKRSALFSGKGKPGRGRAVAIVVLVLTLLAGLLLCSLSALPLPWVALNSLRTNADAARSAWPSMPFTPTLDAYTALGKAIPVGPVLVNTVLPPLLMLLLLVPVVYLGALGIGAARPLGKWSEWLLLPFSPWLFVTIGPLSIAAWQILRAAGQLDSFAALTLPLLLSLVPMLFVLTLFFKGQERQWRATRTEGRSALGAFFTRLILPSLPLVVLLSGVALLISAQDLLWPVIVARSPASYTMTVALVALRAQFAFNIPVLAAGLTLFGLLAFAFFFLIFGLLQVLYLDRLALGTHLSDAKQ